MTSCHVVLPDGLGFLAVQVDDVGSLCRAHFTEAPMGIEIPFEHFMQAPVRFDGTSFQKAIWRVLLTIPTGETRSYKWVAEQAGFPAAIRAVANAVAANPLAVRVPCHRVIRSNGALGGYAWGVQRKEKLLCWEKISDNANICKI